ncbi:hypothetical protein E2K93_06450 [Thalassotalea sp. HSM 43]|uniref:hypothetical protein n=1 Tax=Thalassotalea sp. HSM 43 TaxID=2552945 RepID=UPI0010809A2F|nr:hypothetical protein [Thalassotalea sp. HSM 43]QBY04044.1 hypothetical protein E2K93_06450 [Thalassotalea sp. HSM 43]
MELSFNAYSQIFIWLGFLFLVYLFRVFYKLAKKQKGVALAAGLFLQMFLPDPKVQHTIEFIAEKKETSGKAQSDKRSKTEGD